MSHQRPPTIDPAAAARWERTAPLESPWLHEEVARRMEERLQWIRLQPRVWAHWGALLGGQQVHALLARRYPSAVCHLVEADAARERLAASRLALPWWSLARWRRPAPRAGAPADGTAGMLWSNMALHAVADPQALIARWHRALAVDGFLMFSCLGPDSLSELRALYARQGWPPPGHEFTDMHDWGDMLVQAGFAEPVMDMERITLSYETPQRLLAELRDIGRNLHPARFAGLRTPRWRRALEAALRQGLASDKESGRLVLTMEVIYGHALKPPPRLDLRAQTTLSLEQMREALRHGKSQR